MAVLKSCENVDHDLCSGQQNWTWRHYNICSEVQEKAKLEFSDEDLICYFVKLVMFLVHFCSKLPKRNLDYMTCLKQFGISAGMCSSVFPDLDGEPFLDCFNTIVDNAGGRTNESETEWFYHVQNVVCFNERTSHIGICMDTMVQSSVFNITWFASSETVIMVYSYVFPAVGIFVIFINIILLIVMLQIISNDTIKLLLCTIAMCEILTVLTVCSLFFGILTMDRYHDYLPYVWCIVSMLILDIFTPLFHALSIWFTLGMAIQRYLIIKYPFTARRYDGKKSRNLVLLYMTITLILSSMSHVPHMLYVTKMKPWPFISKTDITKEIVTATVMRDETSRKLRNTAYTTRGIVNNIIPTALIIIFEIALILALHKQRKHRQEITNNPSANKKIRLINVLTSIIVMTVLVAEMPSAIVTFLSISGYMYGSDPQDSTSLLNFLPLVLYPANLIICCCIAKDFRDKLFECFRKLTKC